MDSKAGDLEAIRRPGRRQSIGERHSRGSGDRNLLFHTVLLGICLAVLVAAFALEVRGEQVIIPLAEVPLPGVCAYKRLWRADCPGCGLTRCFISLSHGRIADAWKFNPAGIFLFALVVAQLPVRLFQISRTRQGLPEIRLRRTTGALLWLLCVVFIVQGIVRTVTFVWPYIP